MKVTKINLIFFITLIFIISIVLRWDYLGTLSEGHHQWGTAQFKLVVDNWIQDGIIESKFLRALIPSSVEYTNLLDRGLYVSYPIGVDVLIYFIKLIFKNTETLILIHILNLFFQYFICILIFSFVNKLKIKTDQKIINFFALVASIAYIFLPIPFYYQFIAFGYDQAMVLTFIAILFLELLIRTKNNNKYFIYQSIVFFISGFFDYFSIILAASILLFRIIKPIKKFNLIKNLIQIILPISIPFIFFIFQLYQNNFLTILYERFTYRTGVDFIAGNKNKTDYYSSFIFHFWVKKFHIYLPIIAISIYFLIKNYLIKKSKELSYLIILIGFFACFFYAFALQNLHAIHDYTTLKFYPLISITFFALIPLEIIQSKNKKFKKIFLKKFVFSKLNLIKYVKYSTIIILIVIILTDNLIRIIYYSEINKKENYILYNSNIFKNTIFAQFPYPEVKDEIFLKKIKNISEFNDVYISFTDIFVNLFPPQKLSITKKIITKISSEKELYKKINSIPDKSNIKIIIYEKNLCKKLFKDNRQIIIDKKIILYTNKSEFEKIKNCL